MLGCLTGFVNLLYLSLAHLGFFFSSSAGSVLDLSLLGFLEFDSLLCLPAPLFRGKYFTDLFTLFEIVSAYSDISSL